MRAHQSGQAAPLLRVPSIAAYIFICACGSSHGSGSNVAGPGLEGGSGHPGGAGPGQTGDAGQPVVLGGPGCGLPSAAFCATFDAPAATHGRSGELDSHYWSAARIDPQAPTANNDAFGIGPAAIPTCHAGLPAQVVPDQDTLICDPTSAIASPHLLVSAAAQNYGQNSYRIRQPFDFGGRTGKIVFDAQAYLIGSLLGWISLDVTADPTNSPSFALGNPGIYNNEGSIVPENGFELQFQNNCNSAMPSAFTLGFLDVIQEYQQTQLTPSMPPCLATQEGSLNHFEVDVSQTAIAVYATPFSPDGKQFNATTLLYKATVNLPFTRGYVQISTHNHATIKYSTNHDVNSWISRWDNVGFDGPVLSNWREYEVPDSLAPGMDAADRTGPVVNVGYRIADVATGPAQKLTIAGVDLSGIKTARLSLSAFYLNNAGLPISTYALQYRFNGGTWRNRPLTKGEVGVLTGGNNQGTIAQVIDVALSDLVQGNNTLEFVSVNVPQNYPPALANIDLVLGTE